MRCAMDELEVEVNARSSVQQSLRSHQSSVSSKRSRAKGKESRATVEQVLDPRTIGFLRKFISAKDITEFNGCISTGKEANVYHAIGRARPGDDASPLVDLAVKIYKTSILVFRDREKYVRGERRFKSFCSSNPRKMVKLWAEKEMRNLKRLQAAGIPSPEALGLKSHVLLLGFIGKDGMYVSNITLFIFLMSLQSCEAIERLRVERRRVL